MDWSQLAQTEFQTALNTLVQNVATSGFNYLKLLASNKKPKFDLSAHISKTYERCTKVKTIISADAPVDLAELYVANNFEHSGAKYTDEEVIAQLLKFKRIVVSGSAGSGKTFFTRFVWCSFFTQPEGRIPVYLELKKLDEMTSDNLEEYIFHETIVSQDATEAKAKFNEAISEGRFTFILDGFDEVREERRVSIERQILRLSEKGPDNLILVTGRPDDKFRSWQSFRHFRVLPMDKSQVLKLLRKIDFDPAIRNKFIAKVKSGLFEKHRSFLSSPLLATMMLLTFKAFAEIPDKIHVFYEKAFEALFTMHDAMKEAFKRKLHSNLSIDVFKRQFAYFCMLTFDAQQYSFGQLQLIELLNDVKRMTGDEFSSENFIKDLIESVCMLHKDGVFLTFTHRSFQEYFAALCITNLEPEFASKTLQKYFTRHSENVVPMLYDMRRSLVEEHIILPIFKESSDVISQIRPNTTFKQICSLIGTIGHIYIQTFQDQSQNRIVWIGPAPNKLEIFIELMMRIRPSDFKLSADQDGIPDLLASEELAPLAVKIISELADGEHPPKSGLFQAIEIFNANSAISDSALNDIETLYSKSGFSQHFATRFGELLASCKAVTRERESREKSFRELLLDNKREPLGSHQSSHNRRVD